VPSCLHFSSLPTGVSTHPSNSAKPAAIRLVVTAHRTLALCAQLHGRRTTPSTLVSAVYLSTCSIYADAYAYALLSSACPCPSDCMSHPCVCVQYASSAPGVCSSATRLVSFAKPTRGPRLTLSLRLRLILNLLALSHLSHCPSHSCVVCKLHSRPSSSQFAAKSSC
jgi:hypothetical protein